MLRCELAHPKHLRVDMQNRQRFEPTAILVSFNKIAVLRIRRGFGRKRCRGLGATTSKPNQTLFEGIFLKTRKGRADDNDARTMYRALGVVKIDRDCEIDSPHRPRKT